MSTTISSATAPAGTQAVQRVFTVIGVLAQLGGDASLAQLQQSTGLAKSTLHRLLAALTRNGYAAQSAEGRYQLGPELIHLGTAAARVNPLIADISDSLDRLAVASEDTVFYTQRQGTLGVCVDRREGTGPIRNVVLHPGDQHPLGIGAGSLAILAALSPQEASRVRQANCAAFPADAIISRCEADGSLERALTEARRLGYAINPGMLEPSSWAIAIAIRDTGGSVVGALSIASIQQRLGPERIPELVRMLQAEAAALNPQIYGKDPA